MKHLIKIVLIAIVISFGGCYTVLWSPQEPIPSENNNQVYYSEPYYGDYNYYYDNPWWITAAPLYVTPHSETQSSGRGGSATSIDRNSNVTSTRNKDGSRNTPDNNGSIIRTGTPSRNSNTSNDNPVYKNDSNNNSNNSGQQARPSENSRSNEGNNSARNNNGNRNSGNERR